MNKELFAFHKLVGKAKMLLLVQPIHKVIFVIKNKKKRTLQANGMRRVPHSGFQTLHSGLNWIIEEVSFLAWKSQNCAAQVIEVWVNSKEVFYYQGSGHYHTRTLCVEDFYYVNIATFIYFKVLLMNKVKLV